MEFAAAWLWLVFIIVGILLAVLELLVGLETGLDLVIIGSAFIIGGVVSWVFKTWLVAPIATIVLGVAYIAIGRRYVHRWTAVPKQRTNIDAIVGASGIVLKKVSRQPDGIVRVGNEQWRARADEDIEAGEEIVVKSVTGVTLAVERSRR